MEAETFDALLNRLQLERVRLGSLRACLYLEDEALQCDPKLDYPNFPQIVIASMSSKCTFCGSLKCEAEASGLCSSNGKGQVYHKPEWLMSLPNEEAKFLQIYFLGNEEAEAKRRFKLIPGTTKSLIESLQKMLHENNH
ncbi:hypothetical protein AVEN_246509-1 [Araneus ventricosus]|uniref:Uncharacterized protein n=1 Tax=Araneus ventricosus TaxID=182803 RepID=A0A4Y2MFY8_ARAVE|nr:hypothetical protein AVEN_246509-1 [Araneus ventricosus]